MRHLIIMLFVVFTILSSFAYGDTIHFQNGDRFNGAIKTAEFTLTTPYQRIVFPRQLIKSIQLGNPPENNDIVITINHDRFSGVLSTEMVDMRLSSDDIMHVNMDSINMLTFHNDGKSTEVTTAFFNMNNQDRFTGRLLMEQVTVISDHLTLPVAVGQISRLVVIRPETNHVRIFLNDGSLINGVLQEKSLEIESETLSTLTVSLSDVDTIQRNASKFILTRYDGPPFCQKQNDCSE